MLNREGRVLRPRRTSSFLLVREEDGQSTVEFALTLILLLAFILFYFQLCMVFAFGNYVHYATFMSARAYLAAGENIADQKTRARDVIVRLLKKSAGQAGVDKFPSIAKGMGGGDPGGFQIDPPAQFNPSDPAFSWMQGVRYTFKSRLFLIPLAGPGKGRPTPQVQSARDGSPNSVTLTSESWLGREPTYEECQGDMDANGWIFDNGC